MYPRCRGKYKIKEDKVRDPKVRDGILRKPIESFKDPTIIKSTQRRGCSGMTTATNLGTPTTEETCN